MHFQLLDNLLLTLNLMGILKNLQSFVIAYIWLA